MATNKNKTIAKSAKPDNKNLEDSLLDTKSQEGAVEDTAPEGDDEQGEDTATEDDEQREDTATEEDEQREDTATEDDEKEEPTMLIAKLKILYQSHFYEPGERLPRDDAEMEKAWLDAGSAVLKTVSETA